MNVRHGSTFSAAVAAPCRTCRYMSKRTLTIGKLAMKKKEEIDRELALDTKVALSRRDLLKHMGLAGGVAALGSVTTPKVSAATAATASELPQIRVREAFETLTSVESEVLDAMASRILPSDENGPGAHEARAVHFIDRALAGPMSGQRAAYANGLFALNDYALSTKSRSFQALSDSEQDEVLEAMAAGELSSYPGAGVGFFNMVRTHTIEGTFSDPYYGGNRNFVGWDMLGYPGVRMGSTVDDVNKGAALEPSRQSAYDIPPYTKDPVRVSSRAQAAGGSLHGR